MKKILNFRPLFYCFIAFFIAILFAQYLFKTNLIYISIFIVLLVGLQILAIWRKQIKIFLCVLLFFSAGLLGYRIEATTYNVETYNEEVQISGRVLSSVIEDANQKVVLDSILIDDEKVNQNIYVYIYGAPYLSVGDSVEFSDELQHISAFYDGRFSNFYYKNNIRYISFVSGNDISITGNEIKLNESIQSSVKEAFEKSMPEDKSNIAYAMLFGDKSDVDDSVMDNYRGSGIAHILSVSGLHVAIIVGFLYWLLKKFRCPKLYSFILITAILAFYCYLCGFTPSVVRASIMSVCLIGAILIGKKYDSLSAIGLAGLLILLVKPLSAYDLGFQLSFGCVIGIAMFYNLLNKAFRKIKIPKFISSSLSISISAQFLILPVLINAFGGASLFSVFLNVLVVPIFSVAYIIIFISTPLLFISGFFSNFLWFSSLLLEGINICASFVTSLSWSIIPRFNLSFFFMLGFYSFVFILSKYILVSWRLKFLICLSIFIITTTVVTITQNLTII